MTGKAEFHTIEAAYDLWAQAYDTYDNPMVYMAGQALARFAATQEIASVFEFGCGTGRNLALLQKFGTKKLAGCDVSAGMLAEAKSHNKDWKLYQQDLLSPLPNEQGHFDLALFCLTLEHVENLEAAFANAKPLLSANGKIAIFEIHPALSHEGVAAHFKLGGREIRMPTVAHQFAHYINAASNSGLRITSAREWTPEMTAAKPPEKVLKRGDKAPLLLEMVLEKMAR